MESLNVLSSKRISGGNYNAVRILAPFEVTNDFHCKTVDLYNTAIFHGPVTANTVNIEGIATYHDVVNCKSMIVKGSAYFYNNLNVQSLELKNEMKIKNNTLYAETVQLQGIATIKHINAHHIEIQGSIRAEHMKAHKIELLNHVSGEINTIKGPFITIKPTYTNRLTVNQIIGCNVYLSNVKVEYVKGKNITKGPNCCINQIEYI